MKRSACLSGVAAVWLSCALLAPADMLVHYEFNETGSTVLNQGTLDDAVMYDAAGNPADLHTADGGGVSGLSGDRAFDLGGHTYGQDAPRVQANYTTTALSSFTVSLWLNKDALVSNFQYPRLFQYFDANSRRLDLFFSAGDAELNLKLASTIGGTEDLLSTSFSGSVDEWVFFAATYDATDPNNNNLVIYRGATGDASVAVDTFNVGEHSFNFTGGTFTVGNNDGNQRGFDGQIDNMRLYNEVLSASQIEDIRQAGLIPEPGTLAVFVLGAGLLAACRRFVRPL